MDPTDGGQGSRAVRFLVRSDWQDCGLKIVRPEQHIPTGVCDLDDKQRCVAVGVVLDALRNRLSVEAGIISNQFTELPHFDRMKEFESALDLVIQ